MRIKEIAQALSMASSTISICLAGRENDPRYRINPEKAKAVREFAVKHGYVPNAAASKLRKQNETPPVGLLFSHRAGFEKSFPALRWSMDALESAGLAYHVIGYGPFRIHDALSTMRSMGIQKVIAFGPIDEPCSVLRPSHFIVNDPVSEQHVRSYVDAWKITEGLLKHMTLYTTEYIYPRPHDGGIKTGLIRMGCDTQGFVPDILRRIIDAKLGPVVIGRWTQNEDKLVPELIENEELILSIQHDGSRFEEGIRLGNKILELRKKYSIRTVFIANDGIACGIVNQLLDAGVDVPGEIGVLSFGNDEFSKFNRVPLSTFNSYVMEHTKLAVQAIIENRQIPDVINKIDDYIPRQSFKFPTECK